MRAWEGVRRRDRGAAAGGDYGVCSANAWRADAECAEYTACEGGIFSGFFNVASLNSRAQLT